MAALKTRPLSAQPAAAPVGGGGRGLLLNHRHAADGQFFGGHRGLRGFDLRIVRAQLFREGGRGARQVGNAGLMNGLEPGDALRGRAFR